MQSKFGNLYAATLMAAVMDETTATAAPATAEANAATAAGKEAKKPVIIKAEAPAPVNGYVDMKPNIFHFKTETLRNEKGEEIGKGKKHPSVEMYLPIPKAEKLVEFLQQPDTFTKEVDGKQVTSPNLEKALILEAITDQIYRVARAQINELRTNDKTKDVPITPASLNYDKLDWTFIANMPKSERGAYAPDDEELKAFLDHYLEIMPAATNKTKEKIENHVLCFKTGFKKQRAQKEILEMFQDALAIYVTKAGESALEEHSDVIEYFSNKLTKMLKAEENITMDDL